MAGIFTILDDSINAYIKNFEKFLYLILAQIGLSFGIIFFSNFKGVVALIVTMVLSLASLFVGLTLIYLARDPEKMTLEEACNLATGIFLKVILYYLTLGFIFGLIVILLAIISLTAAVISPIILLITTIAFMVFIIFVIICVLPESLYVLLSTGSITAAIEKIASPNIKKNLKYSAIVFLVFIPAIIGVIFIGAFIYDSLGKKLTKSQAKILYTFIVVTISTILSPITSISFWKVFEEDSNMSSSLV